MIIEILILTILEPKLEKRYKTTLSVNLIVNFISERGLSLL